MLLGLFKQRFECLKRLLTCGLATHNVRPDPPIDILDILPLLKILHKPANFFGGLDAVKIGLLSTTRRPLKVVQSSARRLQKFWNFKADDVWREVPSLPRWWEHRSSGLILFPGPKKPIALRLKFNKWAAQLYRQSPASVVFARLSSSQVIATGFAGFLLLPSRNPNRYPDADESTECLNPPRKSAMGLYPGDRARKPVRFADRECRASAHHHRQRELAYSLNAKPFHA